LEYLVQFGIRLGISTIILIVAMILTSKFLGGVDFGNVGAVVLKSAALLVLVTAVSVFIPFGVFFTLAIWFFGLMYLFNLDWLQTCVLVVINWGLFVLLSIVLKIV
jgi:hypothetical protein